MKKEVLVEWNPWWDEKKGFNLLDRELESDVVEWIKRKEIVGVLGVRRSGKTSLLYLLIEHLLKTVNPKNIFFIKCDDDRVEKKEIISKSIDLYKELVNPRGRVFVFVDEVQEEPGWESTLKRIYDLEKNVKFFISGSNFSMLKEDFTYKLSGRFAYFDLYPFSFKELIGIDTNVKNSVSLLSKKQEVKHKFLEYLEFGGFPEVVLEKDKKKKAQLLRFYYDTIIYRDIIKRRGIRNAAKMERMINFFLQNVSNPANFSKIGRQVGLSTDSVGEYVRYLQDAFFIFSVPLFSFSVKRQEINPKKIYCVDTGIRNIKGFRFSQDYGRLVENIVFVEIKRRYSSNPLCELFYWQEKKYEVDFVVKVGLKIKELIQVCWDLEEAKEREVKSLVAAMKKFKLSKGLIITESSEYEELIEGKKIKFIPLWKWLLDVA
ncbi:MAG: ATP-binding protein [Candidatus Woesearchaeota archaeon]